MYTFPMWSFKNGFLGNKLQKLEDALVDQMLITAGRAGQAGRGDQGDQGGDQADHTCWIEGSYWPESLKLRPPSDWLTNLTRF